MNIDISATDGIGGPPKYYVTADGVYQGSVSSPPDDWDHYDVPADWIEVPNAPTNADQLWLFPGWGQSLITMRALEDLWREAELIVIANQLDALEEALAGEIPADILPGTRAQWLAHRGKTRNWKEGAEGYPNLIWRPVRPS